jgi:cyclopropane fatty-acyl-phospholipid synthase-like methyltransferase
VSEPLFDPPYLEHLARLGAADLHPAERRGSARLEHALDLNPGQRVLEIGCGTGQTLIRLAASHDVTLHGVDRMSRMLATARRRVSLAGVGRRVGLTRADGVRLPFADGSFDRVYMESVLGFQTPGRARELLAEVRRVLAPGGRLVANEAVWRSGTSSETVSTIHESSVDDFGLAQATRAGWTAQDWTTCMRESGFTVRSSEPLADVGSAEVVTARPWKTALRHHRAMLASGLLSAVYRARASLTPELIRQRREFRRRLARHRDDGRHIEAYLFVLERDDRGGEA